MEDKNSKLGKLVTSLVTVPTEMFGALADLVEKLVSAGSLWFEPLKRFLRKEPVWGPQEFRVADKFRVDTSEGATPKISSVSDLFWDWFRDDVENEVAEELYPFILTRTMSDVEIIDTASDISGSLISSWSSIHRRLATLENTVMAIFYRPQRVEMSGNREYSYFDCGGNKIVAKVYDPKYMFIRNGQWFILRAVFVRWHDCGWRVATNSVGRPCEWNDGVRVFSRNSGVGSLTRRKTKADSNPLSGTFGP